MKTAVWCTPHAWCAASQVGAHHLCRRLAARGWQVLFLSNPVSPLHLLGWRHAEIRGRLQAAHRGFTREAPNLTSLLPLTMLPFAGRLGASSAWMLASWPDWTLPDLRSNLRARGFMTPDLLVLDGPVAAPLLGMLRPKRSVLRILDRLSAFRGHTPAISEAEGKLAEMVDCVTYSAADLADHARTLAGQRALHLPNGVDAAALMQSQPEPLAYQSIRGPRIVYVGAMAEWFDYTLVTHVARSQPDWQLILIGPSEYAKKRLPRFDNLHLLGPVAWAKLPGYLQHADVGIIPFNLSEYGDLVHGINPLKLYEYAAAGLPTVSVAWREIASLRAPVFLARTPEQFISMIRAALTTPLERQVLWDFAWQHDWDNVLDRLLEAVS